MVMCDGVLQVYSFPEGEEQGILTRFVQPARCLSFSLGGIHLAAGGDDSTIKMLDLNTKKVFTSIHFPEAYVRGIGYDPDSAYLAVTSAGGAFAIFEISSGKQIFSRKKYCTKIDPTAPYRVTPSWHPDGCLVAVPRQDGGIGVFERLSWKETQVFRDDDHQMPVYTVAFSPNGLYLASQGEDNQLLVWDVSKETVLEKRSLNDRALNLEWNPRGNQLICMTCSGDLVVWDDVISDSLKGPASKADDDLGLEHVDQGDEYNYNDYGSDLDRNDDSFVVDDSPSAKRRRRVDFEDEDGGMRRNKHVLVSQRVASQQESFQPGATAPVLGRRYLAYNDIGCITLRSESDHNIVEVNFHDTSLHRRRIPLLNDFYGFTMGSLGLEGALYASASSEHAPATIVFRPFESWSTNADWTTSLPAGEEAASVAVGDTFCIVGTSRRMVRIFSLGGLQSNIISTPGDIVCVFALGDDFGIVHHAGQPNSAGDQILDVHTYSYSEGKLSVDSRICLSSGAHLKWIGFTEEHAVATYDSEGVLRVFSAEFGGSWIPIFDSGVERKGSESFWLFSLSMAANEAQCIVCADTDEPLVPSGSARPVVTAAPLHIPVIHSDDKSTKSEKEMIKMRTIISQLDPKVNAEAISQAELAHDKACLSLFKSLLEQDRASRAFEVSQRMYTSKALEGALRIANHFNIGALVEKIEMLFEHMQMQQLDDDPPSWMNENASDYNIGAIKDNAPTAIAEPIKAPAVEADKHEAGNPFKRKGNPFARKV